jgi:sugar phosphate isomerase/epimerase
MAAVDGDGRRSRLALVSRHVQWADIEEGAAVAAEAGFTAIAWTCRPGAHILPENVERDLPRAIAAARRNGLAVPMLITAINTTNAPRAEAILDSMRQAGITRYRAPNFRYDYSRDLLSQWEALKPQLAALAELNEKYGTTAMFHTHSSPGSVGGGLWDLWLLVKDFAPSVLAINYDLGHAFVRGGTEWMQTARFAHRTWRRCRSRTCIGSRRQDAAPGTWPWAPEFVPPGQGMVNFRDMFTYFKSVGFSGPIEVYYEYEVPLADGRTMNMLGTNSGDLATGDAQGAVHRLPETGSRFLPRPAAPRHRLARCR